ncbi:hypothetical protein [Novosphingobium sp.]|uniref:hypothetical protein n=1 Tax=Novosphingobium sp. TaxID=1874826 RepID=UPI0035AD7789
MEFKFGEAGCWFGSSEGTYFYLQGVDGSACPDQEAAAERIAQSLEAFKAKAVAYLDLFIDRAKACGHEGEDWAFVEIELNGGLGAPVRASPLFMLSGDDGGMWSVELRDMGNEWRPVRFERRQG